jgi:hypothetical protein
MAPDREQPPQYTRYRSKRRLLGGGREDELDPPGAPSRSGAPPESPPAAPGGPRRPLADAGCGGSLDSGAGDVSRRANESSLASWA